VSSTGALWSDAAPDVTGIDHAGAHAAYQILEELAAPPPKAARPKKAAAKKAAPKKAAPKKAAPKKAKKR
jgi:hypothetical protein